MPRPDVLALVLAGGQGSRMDVLSDDRAKPALPFAGVYRLLDFALSNLRHSGIDDVWVFVQYETQSILDVLAGGRAWDLDRSHGGLRIVSPQQESDGDASWHQGNAHALYAHRELIAGAAPRTLLVMSADHIYKLDYTEVLERHRDGDAEVTVVTTTVPPAQASHHAVVEVQDGLVTGVAVKPDDPRHGRVATEVFVYDTEVVLAVLDELAGAGDGGELGDFGDRLLPALIERGRVRAFDLPGYWKDVGRPEAYFEAHRDVLVARGRDRQSDLRLDDASWPILTHDVPRMPAYLEPSARVVDSLISPACRVAGRVERSVLGPGTVVEAGAVVRDSVLFADVIVRAGARLRHAIVDDRAVVGADARVGGRARGELPTDAELVLIGADARVAAEATVQPGDRVARRGRRR